jgi:hypothetical protein
MNFQYGMAKIDEQDLDASLCFEKNGQPDDEIYLYGRRTTQTQR